MNGWRSGTEPGLIRMSAESDQELLRFLEILDQACGKTDWLILAYCLMGNHFHLVIETPQGNWLEGMKWLLGTYSARWSWGHGRTWPTYRLKLCQAKSICVKSELTLMTFTGAEERLTAISEPVE
jgi:putative transposase